MDAASYQILCEVLNIVAMLHNVTYKERVCSGGGKEFLLQTKSSIKEAACRTYFLGFTLRWFSEANKGFNPFIPHFNTGA